MEAEKKLYVVHVGFYDEEPNYGVYESHTNMFVVATSPQEAKAIAKKSAWYQNKKMHTDGVQEIRAVQGFRILAQEDASLNGQSDIQSFSYNDLNPPSAAIGGN